MAKVISKFLNEMGRRNGRRKLEIKGIKEAEGDREREREGYIRQARRTEGDREEQRVTERTRR